MKDKITEKDYQESLKKISDVDRVASISFMKEIPKFEFKKLKYNQKKEVK